VARKAAGLARLLWGSWPSYAAGFVSVLGGIAASPGAHLTAEVSPMAELIRFRCPVCGKRLRARPRHAGKKGHCSCGCPMRVPALPPRQREEETSAAAVRRQLWPWLAAEAAILALATGLAFWLAGSVNRSPDPSQPPRPPLAAAPIPLAEYPQPVVEPPDPHIPEKEKAKGAAPPPPDSALPEPDPTSLGLRLSPNPELVAREEAIKQEWGLLQGRRRAARVQARLGGLEQSGIGHFIPALRVLDGEFHWAGHYAQNLVDADLVRVHADRAAGGDCQMYTRARGNYVVNWGNALYDHPPPAASAPFAHINGNRSKPLTVRMTSIPDGTSNTLMMSENLMATSHDDNEKTGSES
jgi:hypothetical protein